MNDDVKFESLGEPSLAIAGFQLWVHGYEKPDRTDGTDGEWLLVTAHAASGEASVWVSGAIVWLPDLKLFGEECDALRQGQAAVAELPKMEPNLSISIRPVDKLGHFRVTVEITPEHLTQEHRFSFEIDPSQLAAISKACQAIVRKFPVRG